MWPQTPDSIAEGVQALESLIEQIEDVLVTPTYDKDTDQVSKSCTADA
jgi:hypothetical protein